MFARLAAYQSGRHLTCILTLGHIYKAKGGILCVSLLLKATFSVIKTKNYLLSQIFARLYRRRFKIFLHAKSKAGNEQVFQRLILVYVFH